MHLSSATHEFCGVLTYSASDLSGSRHSFELMEYDGLPFRIAVSCQIVNVNIPREQDESLPPRSSTAPPPQHHHHHHHHLHQFLIHFVILTASYAMSTAIGFPFAAPQTLGPAAPIQWSDVFAPRPSFSVTPTTAPTAPSYSPWASILERWNGTSNSTAPVDPFVSRYGISRDDLKKQYITSQFSGYHQSDPLFQYYLPSLITDLSKKPCLDTELEDYCKNVLKMQPRDFLGVSQSQVSAPPPSFFSATTPTAPAAAGSGTALSPMNSTASKTLLEDYWMNRVAYETDASVPSSVKRDMALQRMNTETVSPSDLDTFRAQYASLLDPQASSVPSQNPSQRTQSLPDYLQPSSMQTIVNTNNNTGRSVQEVLGGLRGSVSNARSGLRQLGPESDWCTFRFA